jgi:small-conductance mechanosensitive channel
MGQSAMQFQVSWWIDSYEYRLVSFDRVNTALQNTLDAAGIEMPYPTYNLNFPSPQSDLNRPVELT